MPHIYASVNRVIIGSGNGLPPFRRQAISWTNAGLLSFGLLATNLSEILIGILPFSSRKIHFKMSSAKMAAILSMGRWVKISQSYKLIGGRMPNPTSNTRLRPCNSLRNKSVTQSQGSSEATNALRNSMILGMGLVAISRPGLQHL